MFEETLEIRGINQSEILDYIHALGGKRIGKEEELQFTHNNWRALVSDEHFFSLLQSKVPKVFVTFNSNDEDDLKNIIAEFRKKTFRAGG